MSKSNLICKKLTDFDDKVYYIILEENNISRTLSYKFYNEQYQLLIVGTTNIVDIEKIIVNIVTDNINDIALSKENIIDHIIEYDFDTFSKEKYLYERDHKNDESDSNNIDSEITEDVSEN